MAPNELRDCHGRPMDTLRAELDEIGLTGATEIGHGGFGVVFRCQQQSLNRTVAVKVLAPSATADEVKRFAREGQAMGKLSAHPNIVTVYEGGTTRNGFPYIVMQYLPAGSLQLLIQRDGPLAWPHMLDIGYKLAGALDAAHRRGVLHRDVKPANILFDDDLEPLLTDFGIARIAGAFETSDGSVTGSPAFIAPEVLRGESPSRASDVYSLGATLFCAVTGHAAFERCEGEQVVAQFLRITTQSIPDLRSTGIPSEVCILIEKAMSHEIPDRPPSASAFGEQLRTVARNLGHKPENTDPNGSDGPRVPDTQVHALSNGFPAPRRTKQGAKGNLPIELTSFVGRRREIADIKKLMTTSPMVTLTGAGGVGKTRLSLRVADSSRRAFKDGVWLAALGEIRDPALVESAVASALGIQEQSLGLPRSQLSDYLSNRHLLLVLDNCEHLVESVAALAEMLLRSCRHLKILATSREALGIGGETVLHVPPLSTPVRETRAESTVPSTQYESVQLFVERTTTVVPDFHLDDETCAVIAKICQRLEGLPLPIELAAVRMRAMSAPQILDRLTDQYRLLTISNRGVPPRQQSLRLCCDWSYDLCNRAEQRLWAELSVFTGGFEFDAAAAILDSRTEEYDLLDTITSLINQSVLTREEVGSTVRYRMLEALRLYGREKLTLHEYEALQHKHRDWYYEYALHVETNWIGPRQLEWISRLRREQSNLRVVLEHYISLAQAPESALRMAVALYPFWLDSGQIDEGRYWFEQLIPMAEPGSARTKCLYLSSVLAGLQGDITTEAALIEQAHASPASTVDANPSAAEGNAIGWLSLFSGRLPSAAEAFEQSINASREEDELQFLQVASLCGLALACTLAKDDLRAIACHNEILAISTERGEQVHPGRSAWAAGLSLWHMRNEKQATAVLKKGLQFTGIANDPIGTARCIQALAWIAADGRQEQRAARLIGATETLFHDVGGPPIAFPSMLEQDKACDTRIRTALGRSYDAEIRAGRALSLEEAITFALQEKAPTRPSSQHETGLTPRELEVARLVAEGLSNGDIAARLVISPRTAQGHVEHILSKRGFNSRSQIAAWVVESSIQAGE